MIERLILFWDSIKKFNLLKFKNYKNNVKIK